MKFAVRCAAANRGRERVPTLLGERSLAPVGHLTYPVPSPVDGPQQERNAARQAGAGPRCPDRMVGLRDISRATHIGADRQRGSPREPRSKPIDDLGAVEADRARV